MNAGNHFRMKSRQNIAPKTHKQLRVNGQGCQTPLWAESEVSNLHMEIMMPIAWFVFAWGGLHISHVHICFDSSPYYDGAHFPMVLSAQGREKKEKKTHKSPPLNSPRDRIMSQCTIWFTALHLYLFFWQPLFSKAAYDPCLELSSWRLRSLLKGLLWKCWDLATQPFGLEDSFVIKRLEHFPESV